MSSFRMSTGEVIELTKAEVLLLDRRRRGESQSRSARRWRVSYQMYSAWELGIVQPSVRVPGLGKIQAHERAFIYRKRAGSRQMDVARDLGVCPFTVRKMERGVLPCDFLLEYWEA